ncbi:MAG: hypothetical protein ACTSYA_08510 [Candidatus Kariarchaeaceae archaeon]
MNKKLSQLILVFVVYYFLASSCVQAINRPTYALNPDNLPFILQDYEMAPETEVFMTVGNLESYIVVYVSPVECWPVNVDTPCTSVLSFSYSRQLDEAVVEMQDKDYFETLRSSFASVYASQSFEDVTDDIPGAALAYLYILEAGEVSGYIGVSYVGYQTGLFFTISEATLDTIPSRGVTNENVQLRVQSKTDLINAMVGANEVAVADLDVDIGGSDDTSFGSIVIITGSLMVSALIIRRRRN